MDVVSILSRYLHRSFLSPQQQNAAGQEFLILVMHRLVIPCWLIETGILNSRIIWCYTFAILPSYLFVGRQALRTFHSSDDREPADCSANGEAFQRTTK